MLDGLELAKRIAARPGDLSAAVRVELSMFEQGAAAAQDSLDLQSTVVSPDAAQRMLHVFGAPIVNPEVAHRAAAAVTSIAVLPS
jgi:hypothetical protein